MAQEIRDVVFNIQVRTEDGAVKIEGLTKGFVKAETAFKRMQTTLTETNKTINATGVSSGLANTAVLEFGRTISDAPFGIQGMGNNITQLVTILGQMQGELKEGETLLGNFRKAMIGPLGIVIAVQVVVSALEFYRQAQSKVIQETNKFNESLADLNLEVTRLEILGNIVRNNSGTLELQEKALAALKDNGFDPTTQSIEQFIEAQQKLAIARATAQAFSEEIVGLEKERLELIDIGREQLSELLKAQEDEDEYRAAIIKAQIDTTDSLIDDLDKQASGIKGRMEKLFENVDLVDFLFGGNDSDDKKERREKIKKLVVETYDIAIVEAENRRKEIEKKFKSLGLDVPSMILGGEEGKKALGEGILGLVDGLEETGTAERLEGVVKNAIFPEDVAMFGAELLGTANDLLASEADRAIAIETNKTNALNDQLRQRLANEKLSAEERDKINQQISRNEAALVARENEINKKRFEQQKALNLALAVIDTYVAANMALRDKTLVSTFVRVAAMVSIIASGLANVATISRQQFTSKAMPTPNLIAQRGGGPAESQGPAFNVVGASAQSQLAQAIAAQQRDPVRAYVVAGEVTTAQSLERNKIQEASI